MPFVPAPAHFLNRHPALRDLALVPSSFPPSDPLSAITLPALKHLRTVSEALPALLAGALSVELVFLQHSFATPNLTQLAREIDALAALSPKAAQLRALWITRPVLNLAALIATRLSRLETLAIYRRRPRSASDVAYEMVPIPHCFSPSCSFWFGSQHALPRMAEYLSNFPSLSCLRIQYAGTCY